MIRFFHTADIHFGVENYGRIDPQTGIHTRLLDFRDSLSECIDAAIKSDIDLFVFSGDAYKTPYPTPTQQKLLMEQLFRLYQAKIPAAIVVGNHDHPLSYGKANALDVFGHLPIDGFHVFSKPEAKTIQTKSGPVQVVGIPWPSRNNLVAKDDHRFKDASQITVYLAERVGKIIKHLADQLDPHLPSILAGHLTVSTGVFSGSEKCAVFGNDPVLLPSQLAIKPFDYVALGHLHRYQDLNKKGYPSVVYAGSTERVDFGERKEPKGYCSVHISAEELSDGTTKKDCAHEFVKLNVRPMIQIDVRLHADKDQTEQVLAQIEKHDLKGALVKVVYHVPQGKKDSVDLLSIQRALSKAHYVAGIVPVHKPVERERRAALKVNMAFANLLESYFDTKIEDKKMKQDLLAKATQLHEELVNPNLDDGNQKY